MVSALKITCNSTAQTDRELEKWTIDHCLTHGFDARTHVFYISTDKFQPTNF